VEPSKRVGLGALIGVSIYLIMHFIVPHSLDENTRSLIAAAIAFVLFSLAFGTWRAKTP
jgi:hypothetical protein